MTAQEARRKTKRGLKKAPTFERSEDGKRILVVRPENPQEVIEVAKQALSQGRPLVEAFAGIEIRYQIVGYLAELDGVKVAVNVKGEVVSGLEEGDFFATPPGGEA